METQSDRSEQPQLPGSGRMMAVMGCIGLIASSLLVTTFLVSEPYINANLEAYLEASISDIVPDVAVRYTYLIEGGEIARAEELTETGNRLFAVFGADSSLRGIVIEAQGLGYADVIKLIYAYSFECDCIAGMKVLESRETPGLGDKIEKDEDFISNFIALDVRWSEESASLTAPLELLTRTAKTESWQIDGITGATISSRAITDILNRTNAEIIPLLYRHKDIFLKAGNE